MRGAFELFCECRMYLIWGTCPCWLQVKDLLVKKLQEEAQGRTQASKSEEDVVVAMMESLDCEVEGCVRIG